MRVVRSWMEEWAGTLPDADTLTAILPRLGYEVAAVHPLLEGLEQVVLAEITARRPIPGSDHLAAVDIVAGTRQTTVVTGAQNGFGGDRTWWAPPGTVLPGGRRLERLVFRGQTSDGMLCSADELGFRAPGDLWIWDGPGRPGDRLLDLLELSGDWVYDLELTPNLAQFAQSVRGVARDLAAWAGRRLEEWAAVPSEPAQGRVELRAPDRCPHYALLEVPVPSGDLPWRWQARLGAVGLRLVSPVVDVTNWVMWEFGQPLHAFDADRVELPIVVRLAEEGEPLTLLDGRTIRLTADDLVIADRRHALGLAGVMGGLESAITPTTRRVLVESAHFTAPGIYRTARRHGLRTDAAERFLRGTDPEGLTSALHRFWFGLTGGRGDAPTAWVAGGPPARRQVPWQPETIRRLLGGTWPDDMLEADLSRLGFERRGPVMAVPSFRPDVEGVADLAEEVGRLRGLDAVPDHLPPATDMARLDAEARHRDAVREWVAAAGYWEIVTRSFWAPDTAERVGVDAPSHRLVNPLREEESVLRTSLLPGLLQTAQFNLNRGAEALALFELGAVYRGRPDAPEQVWQLGVLRTLDERKTLHGPEQPTVYDVTGLFDELARRMGWRAERRPGALPTWAHPGRAQLVVADGTVLGVVGELHPHLADAWRLPRTAVLVMDLPAAPTPSRQAVGRPSRYPAVMRDLSVVWPEGLLWGEVLPAIQEAAGPWLEAVRPFDRYAGPWGTSLALSLVFRAEDRTLTEAEVDAAVERVVARLEGLGASLRR
jgi:phenylalanyl-tRNA synthetase beta chain